MTKQDRELRRNRIAEYIERFTAENRYPPTVRIIAKEFNIKSTNTVFHELNHLVSDGRIGKVDNHYVPNYTDSYLKAIDNVR